MKVQKQLFRHDPENGAYGDCHRTAIACILGLDAHEVPNFMHGTIGKGPAPEAHAAAEKWLNDRGFTQINIAFNGEVPLDLVLDVASKNSTPNMPFIFGGESKTGVNHSVVALNGKIVCDPSLDDSGIVGPMDDGYYWATFFGTTKILHEGDC